VLSTPYLSDKEYFHACNILKTKMMYDFAALKAKNLEIGIKFRDNIIIIIKSFVDVGGAPFNINSLCTTLAYLIMHIHQQWDEMFESLVG